jgi:hypothetical protein
MENRLLLAVPFYFETTATFFKFKYSFQKNSLGKVLGKSF